MAAKAEAKMAAALASQAAKQIAPTSVEQHQFIVRATYRHLHRAMGIAFKDDVQTKRAAVEHAREQFRSQKISGGPGSLEMAQRIEHAQGVTQILLENVVQGRLREDKQDQYKLRIHDKTQRHDNEDTKRYKGSTKTFAEIRNATF